MVQISVQQLKSGDRLLENVLTPLGSILFYKGSVIEEREKEILQAFLIEQVKVERKVPSQAGANDHNDQDTKRQEIYRAGAKATTPKMNFQSHYQSLLELMKKVFKNTSEAENLPIVDLRSHLEAMVGLLDQQEFMTYSYAEVSTEDYLYHKSIMVALISYTIARWADFHQKDLMPVALAGLLHDIGNMGIDRSILDKKGKLTPDEMEEMKKHTVIGYNRLKNVMGINEGVKLAALQHHEREDGSGYPLGVKGDRIHSYAKVVAIADIFYAMTQTRKYRIAKSPYEVFEQLTQDSFGKLDPALVQTFVQKSTRHQLGYTVRLSNGSIGKIVYSDRANPTRPWVDVNGTIVNLAQDRSKHIIEIISRKVD